MQIASSPWSMSPALLARLAIVAIAPAASAAPPSFSNQTASSGLVASHSTSGFTNWQYAGGGAVGDFNRDGWMDVFFISGGSGNAPDRLFINNGNGTFTNQAPAWGLTTVHRGKSACVGDFDNDGWPDLYVTSAGPVGAPGAGHHKLYRNNGGTSFTNVAAAAGVAFADPTAESAWTAAFGDYDLDGDLDLFVGGFAGAPSNTEQRLFRNNGNGTFTDITASIGLLSGIGPIALLAVRFADMNGDRYPEILAIGDFKGAGYIGSRYFRNNGNGTFTDATNAANVGNEENGMGQAIGDFDNNGLIDWYATSIHQPSIGWTGNKLYRNLGTGAFAEIAASAGVADGGYGWGAVGVDVNHDGWEDLLETNGDAAPGSSFYNDPSYLWLNNGNNTFTDVSVASGFIFSIKGRALLRLDADNDGDQDILIYRNNGTLTLFRNDLVAAADTRWLRIFLDPRGFPGFTPDGIGARVTVVTNGQSRVRLIDSGVSFLGTSEFSAHFGLGSATIADEVRVLWQNGVQTVLTNVPLNQTLTITPADPPCDGDLDRDGTIGAGDLGVLLGAWGTAAGDLDGDGTTGAADLSILLGGWGGCL
jgi:hypothetical protein